ncbi:MAG: hypothetical protein QG594_1233, partial [Bacteroidota bacterium]|nr:hypothetical protein [Bacteroidota bacterium]
RKQRVNNYMKLQIGRKRFDFTSSVRYRSEDKELLTLI